MAESVNFTTPVGRLVQGSLYKGNDTDAEGRPLVVKTGANAGNQIQVPCTAAHAATTRRDALFRPDRELGLPRVSYVTACVITARLNHLPQTVVIVSSFRVLSADGMWRQSSAL